ncbi:MAG: MATE family efflux transporter [Bacteroidota bacterium]|jgi:putative MATE family efflux protein|nr:MATE family efflux transporter [Bacteroidota bacterium]
MGKAQSSPVIAPEISNNNSTESNLSQQGAALLTSSVSDERLGKESINRLLLEFAIPSIVAMTATSIYNVVDRIFIGNAVGPMAIAGLALVMPVMNLLSAFGSMVGAGASSMVSIRLGQQRREEATSILGNTLILNFLIGGLLTILGLIFLDDLLILFGASPKTLPYARDFMQIILIANVLNHNFLGLNSIMRASGYPKKAMWSSLLTVGVNVALAPLFIFGFKWGIRGAALATAFAQLSGFIWVTAHFANKKHSLHFKRGYFKLRLKVIGDILSIGLSPFFMHLSASLVVVVINKSLAAYGGEQGDLAIGAYGIVNSVVMLILMLVLGLNMGMQPVVGYNFGARKNDRMLQAYRNTILVASLVTTSGFFMALLFPRTIVSVFTDDPGMIDLSVTCLKTVVLSFPVVGFQMVTTTFFQSIGKAAWSVFLSLSRQLIFLIPGIIIMPRLLGLKGVWVAMPLGDFLASLLTLIVIITQIRKYRSKPLPAA